MVAWLLEDGFYGYSPLGEKVSLRLLPAKQRTKKIGEIKVLKNAFYGYSPLGERVGCTNILRWGEGGQNGYNVPGGEAGF